jgi:hypothetical protein
MMLKVLFYFNTKQSVSHIYPIASVSYSKDDAQVFKKTVLDAIGSSLKLIVEGGYSLLLTIQMYVPLSL